MRDLTTNFALRHRKKVDDLYTTFFRYLEMDINSYVYTNLSTVLKESITTENRALGFKFNNSQGKISIDTSDPTNIRIVYHSRMYMENYDDIFEKDIVLFIIDMTNDIIYNYGIDELLSMNKDEYEEKTNIIDSIAKKDMLKYVTNLLNVTIYENNKKSILNPVSKDSYENSIHIMKNIEDKAEVMKIIDHNINLDAYIFERSTYFNLLNLIVNTFKVKGSINLKKTNTMKEDVLNV